MHRQSGRRSRPGALGVAAVVCFVLLALLAVAQVAHVHPLDTDADHCPLCIVMHSAAPVAFAAAIITLVQVGISAPAVTERAIVRHGHTTFFIRPPPIGC